MTVKDVTHDLDDIPGIGIVALLFLAFVRRVLVIHPGKLCRTHALSTRGALDSGVNRESCRQTAAPHGVSGGHADGIPPPTARRLERDPVTELRLRAARCTLIPYAMTSAWSCGQLGGLARW